MNNSMHIKTNPYRNLIILLPLLLFVLAASTLLTACASKPLGPSMEMSTAEQSLIDAEQARVADYALPELQDARRKLSAARVAAQNENMLLANRLAEQASWEIKLASAKSELAKAQSVNEDMKNNIHTLKQEMNRNTGESQ